MATQNGEAASRTVGIKVDVSMSFSTSARFARTNTQWSDRYREAKSACFLGSCLLPILPLWHYYPPVVAECPDSAHIAREY